MLTQQVPEPGFLCSHDPGWLLVHPKPGYHSSDRRSQPGPCEWSAKQAPVVQSNNDGKMVQINFILLRIANKHHSPHSNQILNQISKNEKAIKNWF